MAEAVKTADRTPLSSSAPAFHNPLAKRKHRRGKKSKTVPKKTKTPNPWKQGAGAGGGGGGLGGEPAPSSIISARVKLVRSRSLLVPYNTNRFLMEEHMSDMNKDDSDDNCFGSQTEDQELFLSKEFSSVYERARMERLETMSKQELIQECLQIEDRYSKDQGRQRQQSLNAQNISKEYSAKIRALEDKIRELSRENQMLRSHLLRSPTSTAVAAAAASPPSAAAPTASAQQLQQQQEPPTAMDSSSEDSESDSSSTTSSTTSSTSSSSSSGSEGQEMGVAGLNIANGHAEQNVQRESRSRSRSPIAGTASAAAAQLQNGHADDRERRRLLSASQMDQDNSSSDEAKYMERGGAVGDPGTK